MAGLTGMISVERTTSRGATRTTSRRPRPARTPPGAGGARVSTPSLPCPHPRRTSWGLPRPPAWPNRPQAVLRARRPRLGSVVPGATALRQGAVARPGWSPRSSPWACCSVARGWWRSNSSPNPGRASAADVPLTPTGSPPTKTSRSPRASRPPRPGQNGRPPPGRCHRGGRGVRHADPDEDAHDVQDPHSFAHPDSFPGGEARRPRVINLTQVSATNKLQARVQGPGDVSGEATDEGAPACSTRVPGPAPPGRSTAA